MVKNYILRLLPLLLFFCSLSSNDRCFGERDWNANTYGKFTNPNVVAFSHYWADAQNVYQDLSSFKKLYVKFHSCAWSSQQSYKNDKNGVYYCGLSTSQSEDYWWMGMQPCMGANVAFSLYGILTSETSFVPKKNPCSKARYINSFYTTDGLQTFTTMMGLTSSSSYYYDDISSTHGCTINDDGYGIALGCSIHGAFTLNTFNGSCYKSNYISTVNKLNSFNQELIQSMDCFLIYSSDGSVDYATDLLSKSSACQLGLDQSCPDPYGVLRMYEDKFMGIERKNRYSEDERRKQEMKFVCILMLPIVGVALVILRVREMRKLHQSFKRFRYTSNYVEEEEEEIDDGGSSFDSSISSKTVDTSVAYAVFI